MTVTEVLTLAMQRVDRLDAQLLLAHTLSVNRAWLIAHAHDEIPAAQIEHFLSEKILKRAAGEPVAYLVRSREFYGRDFACTPAALVPRPETELLVDAALARGDMQANGQPLQVLDLGTGTGCIGLTLACERPHWQVTVLDVSSDALALARENATRLGITSRVDSIQSDWFDALSPTSQFDLIVSNPPYIAPDDAHLRGDGLRFEPRVALTDERDGLSAYRALADQARTHLRAHGWILVEHGFAQGAAVRAQFARFGDWAEISTLRDLSGNERVTIARYRPAATSA